MLRACLRSAPLVVLLALACDGAPATSPWDDAEFRTLAGEAIEAHVHVVIATYADMVKSAEQLQADVDAFLAAPSAAGLAQARSAWLAAREVYGQTEAFRFYGGPIDAEPDNLEARINSWPLDEVYIDYVDGVPEGGVINDPTQTIDRASLIALNTAGGEDDISTGWHAIEFLLWGQDHRVDGPGERPYTDYVAGPDGTAANQDRRAAYLEVVTDLLVDDLKTVSAAWAEGAAYLDAFEHGDPRDSLTKILLGMGSLSGAELSGERMGVAFDTREQEDEHSCFSDNTHRDLYNNALGLENVYLGRYGALDGVGLGDLIAARDPELDSTLRVQLRATVEAMQAIPPPFDQAIQAPDGDPARDAVGAAIAALKAQTKTIAEAAALLDITLNLEE
ncbi:MAG: iron-regulated protein [Nannocystis sp.]|uniref:imelysin family protein n=1 Tax=Nannocystis sp. TaxID=1962667 RepID=UPI0024216EF1|nr:imelysin family protein [Nannocystis sp.]MBK9755141.1 iron-regulated protein [Nannocystis sp.]